MKAFVKPKVKINASKVQTQNESNSEVSKKQLQALKATDIEKTNASIKKLAENKLKEPKIVENLKNALEAQEAKAEQIEQNRENGAEREETAKKELEKEYPESKGYKIEREQYLRDKEGKISKDHETGEARRIDFVVYKGEKIVKTYEVTSKKAPKSKQLEKENRIRENGGEYIRNRDTRKLVKIPKNVQTSVRRYE